MDILNRLIHLGSYLLGNFIVIDPSEDKLVIDNGIYDKQQSKEIAVEYFHKTYTDL